MLYHILIQWRYSEAKQHQYQIENKGYFNGKELEIEAKLRFEIKLCRNIKCHLHTTIVDI